MRKIKSIFFKYREIVMYVIFGVLTTAVSWGVYFLLMLGGRRLFSIPENDAVSAAYLALYTAAQVISWICAVLFSFFTNRAYVFTDADRAMGTVRQLVRFSSGRLITLGLDYVITYAGALVLMGILGADLAEAAAKMIAAVAVMIGNYIFGKLFVFKKKKGKEN